MSTPLPPGLPNGDETPIPVDIEAIRRYLKKIANQKLRDASKLDLEASDLVGDVLKTYVESQAKVQRIPPAKQRFWFRRVLVNRLTDHLRRRQAIVHGGGRSFVPLDAGGPCSHNAALLDPQETPSRIVSRGEEEELIRAALDLLSDTDRRIVRARVYEDLDFETIGRRNGLSAEAARKRYERAVTRLGRILPIADARSSGFPFA